MVNAAAVKLSEELFNMIDRPDYALVTRVREGTENQVVPHISHTINTLLLLVIITDIQEQVRGLGRSDSGGLHTYRRIGAENRRRPHQVGEATGDEGRPDRLVHASPAGDAVRRGATSDGGVERGPGGDGVVRVGGKEIRAVRLAF